jgi:hypothetical protein
MLHGYIDIAGLGASVAPLSATQFENLSVAKDHLASIAREHFSISNSALLMWLFAGELTGDEHHYGYPDTPEHVLRAECNEFTFDIQITDA